MGYFANGTEGEMFEEEFCERCIHMDYDGPKLCPVLEAHWLYNYDECNNPDSILHILIPRNPDGSNGQCKMFVKRNSDEVDT